jgi:hypothetical protein
MWRLVFQSDVDVWYNATGYRARAAYYSLGLEEETHLVYHNNETVRTFTYGFAIQELWKAEGMPSTTVPRIAAGLLVLFSGIWPHLKLMLLLLTWLLARPGKSRRRSLNLLSALGKWSLADVLVVCVMVGVLNLDWVMDPTLVKNGLVQQVPLLIDVVKHLYSVNDVCSYLLHVHCESPPSTWSHAKCISCRDFVSVEFDHPETTRTSFAGIAKDMRESGSGYARLRVEGMTGIYAFCAAVVLSIILSIAVDVFDLIDEHESQDSDVTARSNEEESGYEYSLLLNSNLRDEELQREGPSQASNTELLQQRYERLAFEASLGYTEWLASSEQQERSSTIDSDWAKYGLILFSFTTAFISFIATFSYSLERRVTGAVPQLMHEVLGMVWDRPFSLHSLVHVTGAAKGWDVFLMTTFGLFVLVGPIMRAILCLAALSWPCNNRPSKSRRILSVVIDFMGAFCAWEVIALACYLVSLLMPTATSTIIMRPECAKVDASGSCLEVSFNLQSNFVYILIGGIFLVLSAACYRIQMPYR